MIKKLAFLPFLSLPLLCSAAPPVCTSASQCRDAGNLAFSEKNFDDAMTAFERQLRYQEDEDTPANEQALNNLVRANWEWGNAGMARAWLKVALASNMSGAQTRRSAALIGEKMDVDTLRTDTIRGTYLRYDGYGVWSSVVIGLDDKGTLTAEFEPSRMQPTAERKVVPNGRLTGQLESAGAYHRLVSPELGADCAVEILDERPDLQVIEAKGANCQLYGSTGVSVSGTYLKVANPGDG